MNAEYIKSSEKLSQCPEEKYPEFAFIGRSNVGKSSLINMLTGRNGLAKISSTPGKTITINHFLVDDVYFVDLPGYGYAKRSRDMREVWEKNLWHYLMQRRNLMYLFVLIDSRITPQKIDIEFINKCGEGGLPIVIVFTKTDKEKESLTNKNIQLFKDELLQYWDELPVMIESSSQTKKGKKEIWKFIKENMKTEQSNPIS
ncbi:ribosome biogenesis GTP-binding protein YihA/YsxC [soil metagenome]